MRLVSEDTGNGCHRWDGSSFASAGRSHDFLRGVRHMLRGLAVRMTGRKKEGRRTEDSSAGGGKTAGDAVSKQSEKLVPEGPTAGG